MEVDIPMHIKPGELRCPKCFHLDIVPSLRRTLLDALMHHFDREPRHCRACGHRFYVHTKKTGGRN